MKKMLLALVASLVLAVSGSAQAGTNKTSVVWFSVGYESVSVLEDCYRSFNYSYGYCYEDDGYLAKMGYFALGPKLCFPVANRRLELSASALALFGGRRFDDKHDYNYEYSHAYDYESGYYRNEPEPQPPSYPYGYALAGSLSVGLVKDAFYVGVRGRYASIYKEVKNPHDGVSAWVSENSVGPMVRLEGGNFAIEGGFLLSSEIDATDFSFSVEFGF
jgi:hypothetical protein